MDTSKIIKGVVNSGRYTVTAPIVKEDYGLYLKIEGVELPSTYEVDFSNDEHHGTSVTMIGNSDGVLIPSQFISSGKDVFAFLYHVGADFGRTVYKFRIPNKCRPDRTDDTPTPEEQSVIDQAISALNTAVAQTAQDVISADQSARESAESAQASGESALSASNSALSSGEYASNALGYAESAQASATASAQSASDAETARQATTSLAAEAQGYADASEQSASASANSASQAQGYAQSASSSAQSASGYASNAQSYSQTASAKAQDASQSATTASQKATESAQSATNAQGYANTAETAKTDAQTAQGLAESARNSAITAKTDAESARDEAQNLVDGISGKVEQIDSNTERIESLEDDRYKPYPTDTASGSIASFSDGADNLPLKSLVVDINPVQDKSSGDPSPENICPIIGWTGTSVVRTGFNQWDEEWELGDYHVSVGRGEKRAQSGRIRCKNFIPVVPNETYYCTTPDAGNTIGLFYDENKTYGSGSDRYILISNRTFVIPEWAHYMTFYLVATSYNNDISINYPSTDHDYHSYTGQVIPISWQSEAGTVYGGKLDVLSGELTVDRAMVDLGTLFYTYIPSQQAYPFFESPSLSYRKSGSTNLTCSIYKTATGGRNTMTSDCMIATYNTTNSATITIRDERFTDAATFKSAISGQQLVYELAEPIEIQLSANQINSLYGVNNIWADSGDTEVVYRADTKTWIQRKIAEAVASLT